MKSLRKKLMLAAFAAGVEGAGSTLWRGTPYMGETEGVSLFLHDMDGLGRAILEAPASSWKPPHHRPFTKDKDQWIDWHHCRPGMDLPPR